MNVLDAIQERRSVKHFDPDHKMTPEEVEQIFSLAALSPTAFNIQNWRLLNVVDPEQRKKIRAVAWDQAQVTDASMLLVLCADLNAWEKEPGRYWANSPKEFQNFMLPALDDYYRGKNQVMRDEAMRSCGMIAQTLMLTAKGMGYDSCPMDGFDFDAVADIVNLPDDHVISMFVVIGKATEPAKPRGGQLPLDEVITVDSF